MKSVTYLRRNRKTPAIREMLSEVQVRASDIVAPFYVIDGHKKTQNVDAMPGVQRLSKDLVVKQAEYIHEKGIQSICLFPVIEKSLKNFYGSEAINLDGLIPETIRLLKKEIPSLTVIADVALDPYTSHGHDGIPDKTGYIDNSKSLRMLKAQAIALAQAGVDIVAPSDMMDGRVFEIRKSLDKENHSKVSILSYASKYASSTFYSPFREALNSAPSYGDKKTYQLSPNRVKEGLFEANVDEKEGADMLLVKPGLLYLDILQKVKESSMLPVGAFHVSGEYSMIMAADKLGFLSAKEAFLESFVAFKRAGADFIITYGYTYIF